MNVFTKMYELIFFSLRDQKCVLYFFTVLCCSHCYESSSNNKHFNIRVDNTWQNLKNSGKLNFGEKCKEYANMQRFCQNQLFKGAFTRGNFIEQFLQSNNIESNNLTSTVYTWQ